MAAQDDHERDSERTEATGRRRHPRYPVGFVAHVRQRELDATSQTTPTTAHNLSPGGIFIRTDELLNVGEHVELDLEFPGEATPITVIGVVRWLQDHEPEGAGIEFLQASSGDEDRLEQFLQERHAEIMKQLKPGRSVR